MPPALHRLLASPSASRLLRTLAHAPEPPTALLRAARRCRCITARRSYASRPLRPKAWRRWKEETRATARRERERAHEDHIHAGSIHKEEDTEGVTNPTALAERLQREERLNGVQGIRDVWDARGRVDLPTADTPDAEFLWGTFIKDPELVLPVIYHAIVLRNRTGQVHPHLYELCMAYWLPQEQHARLALECHQRMRAGLQLEKLPLRHLARQGRQRFSAKIYDVLLDMYQSSKETDLYDEVVPILCTKGLATLARRWHTLCVYRGDLPSPQVAESPMIRALIAESATSAHPKARLAAYITGSARHGEPEMDGEMLRRLQGPDAAPVRFEDSFCARMFATRGLPPDSVIKGLSMVGVNEIGPLAVRAMASRTDPIYELSGRFEELRATGIALKGCVFSLALEKFAKEKQYFLVSSMLESDQDPEVYDDVKLQRQLLDYYLEQEDWGQAHRTLAILSLFHKDSTTEAWNLLLQANVGRLSPQFILRTLRNMAHKNVLVSQKSILMIKDCLRPRRRARKPDWRSGQKSKGKFDDLRFVTRMYVTILENGIGEIPPNQWREILRRYGMVGRLRELRRLIHWLFCWYAPRGSVRLGSVPKPNFLISATEKLRTSNPTRTPFWNLLSHVSQTHEKHPLRQLFPAQFQQAIIIWGFRAGLLKNAPLEQSILSDIPSKKHYRRRFLEKGILTRLGWSVGLQTLVELRDLGLYVNSNTVVKALQMMFTNLFGRGRSKSRENRTMEENNTMRYSVYVHEVNRIWGRPLFPEPRMYGKSRLYGRMWHPQLKRVVHREDAIPLSEIATGMKVQDEECNDETSRGQVVTPNGQLDAASAGNSGDTSGLDFLEQTAEAEAETKKNQR